MPSHSYLAAVRWTGSTGVGYRGYRRDHDAGTPPAPGVLRLSADAAFRGDPQLPNPEQLVVLAAASCQLLSFLAVAARAGVDVVDYTDEAVGFMPDPSPNPLQLNEIRLRPTIVVAAGSDPTRVATAVETAHRECYIANTLRCAVIVEPTITVQTDT